MRFTTRLILTAVLLAVSATTASAGGRVRNAVQNVREVVQEWRAERHAHRGGCGCASASQPTSATATGPVRQTVGTELVSAGGAVAEVGQVVRATEYQPIRLTAPLPTCPTCVGGNCGR